MSATPTDDPLLGRVLAGAYRLESVLGRGAMGVVYRARHTVLDQDFAVKVLAPDVAQQEHVRKRLLQEAQTLALLSHRNIVAVRHCGDEDGVLYVVMDYCEGESLRVLIEREGALSPDRTRTILLQVLAALDEAHARGVVHRDLKPDNIMIGPGNEGGDPHVHVLDFGLARVLEEARVRMPGAMVSVDQHVVGTVAYMSPEQIRASKALDGRSDLFSLGVMAFEMLAGSLPFDSEDSLSVMMRILESPPPPLPSDGPAGVPRDLRAVVVRALMKDPEDRFQSAGDFAAALRGELDPREAPARTAMPGGTATLRTPARRAPRRAPWLLLVAVPAIVLAGWWLGRYDADAVRADGRTALARCAWKDAVAAFADLAAHGEARGEDHLALARARIGAGDVRARAALDDAASALGRNHAEVLYQRARHAWLTQRDAAGALELLAAAAAAEGAGIEPLLLRVHLLLEPGPDAADLALPRPRATMLEADVAALERRAPDDPRTIHARARLEAVAVDDLPHDEAARQAAATVAIYERAAAAAPAWGEPLMRAAGVLTVVAVKARHEGRADQAAEPMARAQELADEAIARVDAHPHHDCQIDRRAALLEMRAAVRLQAGDYEGGIEDVRAVYEARKDLTTFRQLADRLRTSGHIDEAIDLYERLTAATQDRAAWFDLAFCWQMKGRMHAAEAEWTHARRAYARAVEAYEAALASEHTTFVDHAYLGETLMLLAELPRTDREVLLARAGEAFAKSRAGAPPGGSTEVEHRRALHLCARGDVDTARVDLTRAIEGDPTATPAMHARLGRVLLASAARARADAAAAAALLADAERRIAFAAGMLPTPTAGIHALRAQARVVAAALAADEAARDAHLQQAVAEGRAAEARAQERTSWIRDGLALERRMAELLRGPPVREARVLLDARMDALGGGALRPGPDHYDHLAALARARGDVEGVARATARARTLRGTP